MNIHLAKTQGFCAGVSFALEIVDKSLEKYGSPIYVYHEIVHNTYIVNEYKKKGVIFIEDLNDLPKGKTIIFSAHGVPPTVIDYAKEMDIKYVDATCPLVAKVHNEAVNFSNKGYQIILIGHKGHQEIIGTSGYVNPDLLHIIQDEDDVDKLDIDSNENVAFITQTTLSVDETKDMINKLKKKFCNLFSPLGSDLCYATQNRQDAVKELAKICDIVIICGSPNSSNSNRLRETGQRQGIESYIIDSPDELDVSILDDKDNVGVSSGASVPRIIVDGVISKIKSFFPNTIIHKYDNPEKSIFFRLPEI